jgi:hypothetical protein
LFPEQPRKERLGTTHGSQGRVDIPPGRVDSTSPWPDHKIRHGHKISTPRKKKEFLVKFGTAKIPAVTIFRRPHGPGIQGTSVNKKPMNITKHL